MVNYGRELRIGVDLRRKGKIEKTMEFVENNEKDTRKSRSGIDKSTR